MKTSTFSHSGPGAYEQLKGKDRILFDKVCVEIVKSKKVVVVAGAGLSCSSGIPDFRSENGLYSLVAQMTPPEQDSPANTASTPSSTTPPANPFQTGKDLFTSTTAFSTPHSTSLYLRFIAGLLLASRQAEPTEAHRLLKHMEDKGKLLRLWTQNIDGLEAKVGLRGVKPVVGDQEFDGSSTATSEPGPSTTAPSSSPSTLSRRSTTSKSTIRSPAKAKQPTTMELHGNVHYSRCNLCSEEYVTRRVWVNDWVKGMAVECEACGIRAIEREMRNARPLKSGILLPSLVLYDQPHPQGEDIIVTSDKDILKRPDCLIIMGTSLKVVGIKRLVKDFIRSIRETHQEQRAKELANLPKNKSPRERLPVVFVNKTRPDKEWESLVDVWVEGDCDAFASGLVKVWKGTRPSEWTTQKTLDGMCVVGKKGEVGSVLEKSGVEGGSSGPVVVAPSTPRKNKGRAPLGPIRSQPNLPALPVTPKRKPSVHLSLLPMTPPKTPAGRSRKRQRDEEENEPLHDRTRMFELPMSPELAPKRRRSSPRKSTAAGIVPWTACDTPSRSSSGLRVPGFLGDDESELSDA